jgi:hypothetical protein
MQQLDNNVVYYFELFFSSVLILASVNDSYLLFFLSKQISLLSLALYSLFFIYVLTYITKIHRTLNKSGKKYYFAFLHLVFVIMVITFLLSSTIDKQLYSGMTLQTVRMLEFEGFFLVLFIPLFFLTFVAAYFVKEKKYGYKPALLLFLVAFLLITLYYSSKFLLKSFSVMMKNS